MSFKLEYYNQDNNQIEKIIILSCNFQLNLLNDINILFMDGTFNTCPRSFYQIFNVIGYIAKKDVIFPVMVCLVNAKTERIYDNVFNEFQKLIKYANLKIDFSKIKIMSDFELPLRKSIINNFKESELMGCYFHYIENLYAYMKKLGLCNKNNLKHSLKFIFFF